MSRNSSLLYFSLMKLPLVALREVVENMEPKEMIDFSLCSKKSRIIMKSLVKLRYDLVAGFANSPCCMFYFPTKMMSENPLVFEMDIAQMEEKSVYLQSFLPALSSVSEEENLAWTQIWTDYFRETFNCSIQSLFFDTYSCNRLLSSILPWLNSRQSSVDDCSIEFFYTISNEEMTQFFEKIQCTGFLYLRARNRSDFQFSHSNFFKMKTVMLRDVSFVQLDVLLSMRCHHIELTTTNISSFDWNILLKEWIDGNWNKELKYLLIYDRSDKDMNLVLHGIEFKKRENSVVRAYKDYFQNDETIRGGVDIRRHDGFTSTVVYSPRKSIALIVWPSE